MLDRAKLFAQIHKAADHLFPDFSDEYNCAKSTWQAIAADPLFGHKVRANQDNLPWQLPTWIGRLDDVIPILTEKIPYLGMSVDGSQIYPDRHRGMGCFLLNLGSVVLGYGVSPQQVYFDSTPFVFAGQSDSHVIKITPDYVNCRRQEFEFRAGLDLFKKKRGNCSPDTVLFLCDGSLIFWHLNSKQHELKDLFFNRYIMILQQWYAQKMIHAGYISAPKGKDLVGLVRAALCNFDVNKSDDHAKVSCLIDAAVVRFFLTPGTRSTLFKSTSTIIYEYPDYLQPYFFYIHVGTEIARIEIPAWIAESAKMVNFIAAAVFDQCQKGQGYPVLIAEAHEQAVVKGHDREFFYQLIAKYGIEKDYRLLSSQKSVRKSGMGI